MEQVGHGWLNTSKTKYTHKGPIELALMSFVLKPGTVTLSALTSSDNGWCLDVEQLTVEDASSVEMFFPFISGLFHTTFHNRSLFLTYSSLTWRP